MTNSFQKNAGNFSAFQSAAREARTSDKTHDPRHEEGLQPAVAPAAAFAFANWNQLHDANHPLRQFENASRPTLLEATELERRVLAHERILQELIGHIAEKQPEILSRLKATFGSGHDLGEYEQDYTSTGQYGDHFIRMVEAAIAGHLQTDRTEGGRT